MIGYARVSTDDQRLDLQVDALKRAGCIQIHQEKLSARARKRPKLELALAALEPGDTFVVWRLDRLARSMRDLFARLQQIEEAKAHFKSLTESFETQTAGGRFLLHVMGAVAELESQLIAQRTSAGMRSYAERGGRLGAKRKVDDKTRAEIERLCKLKGERYMTVQEICDKAGVAVSTFHLNFPGGRGKILADAAKAKPKPPAKQKKRRAK